MRHPVRSSSISSSGCCAYILFYSSFPFCVAHEIDVIVSFDLDLEGVPICPTVSRSFPAFGDFLPFGYHLSTSAALPKVGCIYIKRVEKRTCATMQQCTYKADCWKLVNVTAHCCLSLAGTSPLTYPRVPALPYPVVLRAYLFLINTYKHRAW